MIKVLTTYLSAIKICARCMLHSSITKGECRKNENNFGGFSLVFSYLSKDGKALGTEEKVIYCTERCFAFR